MSHTFRSFIKHIHPVNVPLKALELKSTWALGGDVSLPGDATCRVRYSHAFFHPSYHFNPITSDCFYDHSLLADHYIKRNRLESARVVAGKMVKLFPDNKTGYDILEYINNRR